MMKNPNPLHLVWRLLCNLVACSLVYFLLMILFGAKILFIPGLDNPYNPLTFLKVFAFFLPGATLGYTALWTWLSMTKDVTRFNWGAAFFYGIGIGVVNVPVCAALLCLNGGMSPVLGLLFGLISLFLTPKFLILAIASGLILGATNGSSALTWRQSQK